MGDQYRKIAYTVRARCWDGTKVDAKEVFDWMESNCVDSKAVGLRCLQDDEAKLWTAASKAWCALAPGDWVVQEPGGLGFYPVAGPIFEKTYYEYEPV